MIEEKEKQIKLYFHSTNRKFSSYLLNTVILGNNTHNKSKKFEIVIIGD